MPERRLISFGEYRLDLEARQLFRGHERVHLSPKAFALLNVLIERNPAALSKAELIRVIWPGTFVSAGSLTQLVKELRRAGDGSAMVRTVHGFGYAFAGHLRPTFDGAPRPAADESQWSLRLGERDIALTEGENVIGRGHDATIQLLSPMLSRYHARLVVTGDRCVLEDLQSKNGTYLRGERVGAAVPLQRGDVLRAGPFSLTVQRRRATLTTETEQLTAET